MILYQLKLMHIRNMSLVTWTWFHGNHAKCRHGSNTYVFQLIWYHEKQRLPVVYFVIKDMGVDKIV